MQKGDSRFPTTHWTLIARLKDTDHLVSHEALEELCTRYHYPLYCFIRCRGLNHHDAQDVLHDFLAKLLRLDALKRADLEKGRLRTFLASALQRFLTNRHRDNRHERMHVSMDSDIEERFQCEGFAHEMTPEKALERSWAATLLEMALQDLADVENAAGRSALFQTLEPFLSPDREMPSYELTAEKLGQTESAVRQAVTRLRRKFREHLRRRVAETLGHPSADEIDGELSALRSALMM